MAEWSTARAPDEPWHYTRASTLASEAKYAGAWIGKEPRVTGDDSAIRTAQAIMRRNGWTEAQVQDWCQFPVDGLQPKAHEAIRATLKRLDRCTAPERPASALFAQRATRGILEALGGGVFTQPTALDLAPPPAEPLETWED